MSERIKELMKEKNVNQTQLAEIAGVSQCFISNMLKGFKTPSVAVLKRIADHFEVAVDELIWLVSKRTSGKNI